MLNKNTKVHLTNRDNSTVVYSVPDLGIARREFAPGETKTVTFEEVKSLSYQPGGMVLLKEYLVLDNAEAIADIFEKPIENVVPEYFYSKEDVKEILEHGSLDELLDCLDFAPDGVKDLIKQIAVEINLNDIDKRQAIKDKLDYDVTNAIENLKYANSKESTTEEGAETASKAATDLPAGRRTTPKYKVNLK